MKFILVGLYLILTTLGVLLMKYGGNSGTFAIVNKDITFVINSISLIGFACYIISFLLYTRIILMFDLSYIVPICTGIGQILILIAAKFYFHDDISLTGIIGIFLVIIGIVIMNLPKTPIK